MISEKKDAEDLKENMLSLPWYRCDRCGSLVIHEVVPGFVVDFRDGMVPYMPWQKCPYCRAKNHQCLQDAHYGRLSNDI